MIGCTRKHEPIMSIYTANDIYTIVEKGRQYDIVSEVNGVIYQNLTFDSMSICIEKLTAEDMNSAEFKYENAIKVICPEKLEDIRLEIFRMDQIQ